MEMYADKFVKEGLTFDDVLLVPRKSDVMPKMIDISTNLTKNKTIILFFLLGLILGLVIIYFKNFLDNTIKTKEELEHISGLSVISVIEEQEGEKR